MCKHSKAILAILAILVPSCDEGEGPAANPQPSDPVPSAGSVEPCVLAVVAAQAADAGAAAMAEAPRGADPEEVKALGDEAAAQVFATVDFSTIECDPDVTLSEGGTCGETPNFRGWGDMLCKAGCAAAGGMGCGAISVACAGATVITVGGASIPCAGAIIAGCGAAAGSAAVCTDFC